MNNLDALCATRAGDISENHTLPKSFETILRNSMGVLREEGVFAFYIYLLANDDKGGKIILDCIYNLLKNKNTGPLMDPKGDDERKGIIKITEDLPSLLLARQLIERTLTYALYGLKGKKK